ncbi:MAG TPA: hypothetical protein VES42_15055 [Pilimelia sp.]|nr:hypothetical protein [Pilimelia sp.]
MEQTLTEAEKWAADTGQLVAECQSLLGRELTAYVGGVDDPRHLGRVLDHEDPVARAARDRLETARRIVRAFSESRAASARAWLRGVTPAFGGRAPATIIRSSQARSTREDIYRRAELFAAA